jgi:hypothetical protein
MEDSFARAAFCHAALDAINPVRTLPQRAMRGSIGQFASDAMPSSQVFAQQQAQQGAALTS